MNKCGKVVVVGILLTVMAQTGALANEKQSFRTEYTVAAFGLSVGKAKFDTEIIDGRQYKIEGTLRSSGIARVFAAINGSLTAKGLFSGQTVKPTAFNVTYTEGKKKKATRFDIAGHTITGAQNEPPVKERGQWVPLEVVHLANAVDPIGATMLYAAEPRDVCKQTIKAFDGAMRMDINMSYVRTVPFSAKGFSGDIVTCRGRFVPIGGYDANKQDIRWMQDNGVFDVGFAPIGATGYYAPVSAKVKTRLVTVRIRATRFEQLTK